MGCNAGGTWELLDKTLCSSSQTARCESLCKQRGESGCCYLGSKYGCWWKGGGAAMNSASYGGTGTAVTCNVPGELRKSSSWRLFLTLLNHLIHRSFDLSLFTSFFFKYIYSSLRVEQVFALVEVFKDLWKWHVYTYTNN